MTHHDHTVVGIDLASGPDRGVVTLVTDAAIPDGDLATLQQICGFRAEQITDREHTPQSDAELPAYYLPRKARAYCDDAIDYLHRGKNELAIRKLLKAGALILAAVARLRLEDRS